MQSLPRVVARRLIVRRIGGCLYLRRHLRVGEIAGDAFAGLPYRAVCAFSFLRIAFS